MAGEWAVIRLGDVCTKIGSGATPRGGSSVYLDRGEIALIRSQNVYKEGFRREGLAFITPEHARELDQVEVMPGDVLLNITGDSVARCCQVDQSILPARVNQHVAIIRADPHKLDPLFLRYFLVSPNVQARMLSWAGSGGTRNALTKAMIESFEVLAPRDLGEQRAIAHILGTLDDKIELNRRMNETLEAMARAIFKSWFVDFLPVRAKMAARTQTGDPVRLPASDLAQAGAKAEGRLPAPRPNRYYVYVVECENGSYYIGHTDNLERRWNEHLAGKVSWTGRHKPVKIVHYELFNTREEAVKRESDLKTGFGRKWLKDLITSGRARQAGQPFGMDAETALSAVTDTAQVDALFPDSFDDSPLGKIPKGWKVGTVGDDFELTMGQSPPGETYNEVGDGTPFFQGRADFGFRYPSVRVYCTAPTRRANPGDTLVSVRAPVGDINMALDPCSVGRGVAAIRHKTGSRSYTYYAMRSLHDVFARFEAEGTVFGSISKKDFQSISCIIPPAVIVEKFEKTAYPLDQSIENNEKESRTLAAIRDALLPKLLSGEIRVKDAEKFLEEKV